MGNIQSAVGWLNQLGVVIFIRVPNKVFFVDFAASFHFVVCAVGFVSKMRDVM